MRLSLNYIIKIKRPLMRDYINEKSCNLYIRNIVFRSMIYIDIQVLKGFEERHNMINSVCVTPGIAGSNSWVIIVIKMQALIHHPKKLLDGLWNQIIVARIFWIFSPPEILTDCLKRLVSRKSFSRVYLRNNNRWIPHK